MTPHATSRRRVVTAIGVGGVALAGFGTAAAAPPEQRNFRTHLSGDNEVPPVDTNAQGQAKFQLSKAGDELDFKLIVANIDDVVAAHIHCAPEGATGPVGVTLFSGGPTSQSSVLAEGTKTAPDPGNACNWASLNDVAVAMRTGEAYVNVHTLANPGGEIRGQIH